MWQQLRCYLGWHYKRLYKIIEYRNVYGENVTAVVYTCWKCDWTETRKIGCVKYNRLM